MVFKIVMGSFVVDFVFVFGMGYDLIFVDVVIVVEIVLVDVFVRVMDVFFFECFDDIVVVVVDVVVLEFYNCVGVKGIFRFEIVSKGRNCRYYDNDLEVFIVYVSM